MRNRTSELSIDVAVNGGIGAHRFRRIEETKKLYNAIPSVQPSHLDVNHNMTVLAVSFDGKNKPFPGFNWQWSPIQKFSNSC